VSRAEAAGLVPRPPSSFRFSPLRLLRTAVRSIEGEAEWIGGERPPSWGKAPDDGDVLGDEEETVGD
jgi:hypothetical protein